MEAMTSVLKDWIDHIFNHPINEPAWYWSDDAEQWTGPRGQIPLLMAETFERGGELLAGFSDEQLDQGFWYLAGDTPPDFMLTLVDEKLPVAPRLRAIRSFVPLFEQVMAVRCTDHRSGLDNRGASPLNSACFMWWDLLRFTLWTNSTALNAEIIATLRLILRFPHDACRQSALHGIGHLRHNYPEYEQQLSGIIDDFLASAPGLRPELIAYAAQARCGEIL
jgi:hypothetical protein